MPIKRFLNFISLSPNWKSTQAYMDTCNEMKQQLDVTYILRKLVFLDSAISKLMNKDEL